MFITDCFDVGKKPTNLRRPTKVITTFKGYETASECQKQCQSLPYCDAFVYNIKKKSCNVKTFDIGSTYELRTAAGKIFGPKYCPGNITIYICIILNNLLSCVVISGVKNNI